MRRLAVTSLCALLVGCSAAHQTIVPQTPQLTESVYAIGPGDQLQINVYGQPDLSKEYTVTAEGNLSLPLVGQIHAAGLPVVQLEAEVRHRLAEYLVNPQVTVAMQQFRQRFTVLGEVQKPGSFTLEKPTTVMEAVSMAGGLTPKAAPNRTRVIRVSSGQETTIEVPLADVMEGGRQDRDITLQPNDKVVVPESFF
ncbi:MAG: polysaccharide biosynthesis/export family protein [Candidatus Binatia bacterium]